jgi:3-oxoacyl-[acyl-carrier protein] reductase
MEDRMLVKGKNVLITGGAQGIGREMVLLFLKNGASVWYIDIQQGDSFTEYQEVAKANGVTVAFKEGNVADEAGITSVCKEILKESGGIDVLVNNAGITRDNLSFRMSSKDWNDVLAINLTSAFYISKVVVQDMFMKKRPGSVINIASIVGVIGNGGQVNYAASKAGLIGFTKSLAREVASRNIRVNAIAPGFIQTKMTDKLTEEQKKALFAQIPMGRLGLPEDVAKAALFLASDLSSYITGHVLHVTGGLGM